MKQKLGWILCVSLFIILAACGDKETEPVAIDEATDTCSTCNMAVTDNQFATQVILESGKSLVFDDLGCMHDWLSKNKDEKIDTEFVRDFDNEEWVKADEATYVYDKSVKTPMAYNMISFKDSEDAKAYAKDHKESVVLKANELDDHAWERNSEMMQNMKMHGEETEHSHSEDGTMGDH